MHYILLLFFSYMELLPDLDEMLNSIFLCCVHCWKAALSSDITCCIVLNRELWPIVLLELKCDFLNLPSRIVIWSRLKLDV